MWLILQVGWSEGKRAVIRKQLKQNCPHLELRGEALTGEPCSPAPCMPKSSSSAKGINMKTTIAPHDIHRLLHAEHDDPFGVLGLHKVDDLWVTRAFRPDAKELEVLDRNQPKRRYPAAKVADEGLFEAQLTGVAEAFDYLLEITTWSGETIQFSDPYSYGPILGELDMHLYKEGNHYEIYDKLGAHLTEINGHA